MENEFQFHKIYLLFRINRWKWISHHMKIVFSEKVACMIYIHWGSVCLCFPASPIFCSDNYWVSLFIYLFILCELWHFTSGTWKLKYLTFQLDQRYSYNCLCGAYSGNNNQEKWLSLTSFSLSIGPMAKNLC